VSDLARMLARIGRWPAGGGRRSVGGAVPHWPVPPEAALVGGDPFAASSGGSLDHAVGVPRLLRTINSRPLRCLGRLSWSGASV